MNEKDLLAEKIFSQYGSIKRARGPFLYTQKGVRLTDLYLEDGRAILGWGGLDAFTVLKNVLNRGITGSFKTDFEYRLDKAVSSLLNSERRVYVFSDAKNAESAAQNIFGHSAVFWRPWCDVSVPGKLSEMPCVLMVPPLPWAEEIFVLAVSADVAGALSTAGAIKLPAPLSAAVTRSVYDLISALQYRSEKDWFIWDKVLTKYWTRKGPYLFPKENVLTKENYSAFTEHCLKCGVVINPVYGEPCIVPFGANAGVFSALFKNPF